jgi:hypothetical protein
MAENESGGSLIGHGAEVAAALQRLDQAESEADAEYEREVQERLGRLAQLLEQAARVEETE